MHQRRVVIHAVDHKRASSADVVDGLVSNLFRACRLDLVTQCQSITLNSQAHVSRRTTTSKPYGLSALSFSHCASGLCLSNSMYSSPASRSFAIWVLMPLFAAMTTRAAPFILSSCARMRPVGPAPMMRASMPTPGFSWSRPWMAHAAGSTRVASSSVRLWIL